MHSRTRTRTRTDTHTHTHTHTDTHTRARTHTHDKNSSDSREPHNATSNRLVLSFWHQNGVRSMRAHPEANSWRARTHTPHN